MRVKACPFCDGEDLSLQRMISAWGSKEKELHMVCNNCAASAPFYIWLQYRSGNSGATNKNQQMPVARE